MCATFVALLWVANAAQADNARHVEGSTASGAAWVADVPSNWNGTLLLWSRGYAFALPAADNAARGTRDALLSQGYALLGSAYSAAGWSLAEAVPDQLATLDAFEHAVSKPRRVLAWGMSMGGLVTTALVEQYPDRIDGGLALCSSIGGAIGMMNMALDGAFAFKTLLAPSSSIQVTGIKDDRANASAVNAALAIAQTTAAGRARVALAGVLAGIPSWTQSNAAQPADTDYESQQAQIAASFTMGTFLPRADQEARAQGNFSWNEAIDYREQLSRSGRKELVAALYAKAGLDLDADLQRLNAAPRIAAQPQAVQYMQQHYTPSGRLQSPLLAVQAIGDGLTSPSLQRAYVELARKVSGDSMIAAAWSHRAGHCSFAPDEIFASIKAIDQRVATGKWHIDPAFMNQGESKFIAYWPPPMLRPYPLMDDR